MTRINRNPNTLLSLLSDAGYRLGHVNDSEGSFTFTKLRNDGLYELITCNFAGRKRDAVVCRVGVSVTRIVQLKNLTEKTVVVEVASVPERGWTIVRSNEELRDWERRVSEVAVRKAKQFANENSKELLDRTRNSRDAVHDCIEELLCCNGLSRCLTDLRSRASGEQLRVANRLAEWPGVRQLQGAAQVYEAACLAVVTRIRSNKLPSPELPAEMPLENDQLMWEIQLVADKLLDQELSSRATAK
jgi:hypothetical protein